MEEERLDLNLLQRDVAQKLGVEEGFHLQLGKQSDISLPLFCLGIIEFLGYVPDNTQAKDFGEGIANSRRLVGFSRRELACHLAIDPSD